MRKVKRNKTLSVQFHLERYGSITRTMARSHYDVYDLNDVIRRINNKRKRKANGDGLNQPIRLYKPVPGTAPNTKYRLE